MYIPKSFLARLLTAAWTIFLIALLLWGSVTLLMKIWVWIVVIGAIGLVISTAFWLRRLRRDQW